MADRLVVIGGSAGSLDPLRTLAAGLPVGFPAAVLVVMHLAPSGYSALPEILDRAGPLPARAARGGDPLTDGEILVAPPDRHLVVHDGVVHLSRAPRENRHRPSVDALFTTAARWYGPSVVAVVLSGVLDDGTAGAMAVAAQDGVVLVQDPKDAQCAGMPAAALRAVRRARVASADELPRLIGEIVGQAAPEERRPRPDTYVEWETRNVDTEPVERRGENPGTPTALGCPDCQGGMFEVAAEGGVHYVCHVGHSWSPESLVTAQREASEGALYNAASKLLEEAAVLRRLAELAVTEDPGEAQRAEELRREADRAERQAARIQHMVRSDDG